MKLHNRNEKYISQYQARILVVTRERRRSSWRGSIQNRERQEWVLDGRLAGIDSIGSFTLERKTYLQSQKLEKKRVMTQRILWLEEGS